MSKFIGNMVYYHGFPRESAGKCGKFADNLPSPPHRSIAMGQRSCAVLRVWFIVKVPGNLMPPSSVTRGHACVLQGGVSVIGILPTALIENHDSRSSSSRAPEREKKREKVTKPAATRPLGSKDNTKGRSHSQQNDDFGVPRTRLPHATRPPETDSRTLAFSAVLRARKEKKKENIERNDAFKPYGPQ